MRPQGLSVPGDTFLTESVTRFLKEGLLVNAQSSVWRPRTL